MDSIPAAVLEAFRNCPEFLDFPTAWAIQKHCKIPHHPNCSSVPGWHLLSGPGLLCDCGAVKAEWGRIREALNQELGEQ